MPFYRVALSVFVCMSFIRHLCTSGKRLSCMPNVKSKSFRGCRSFTSVLSFLHSPISPESFFVVVDEFVCRTELESACAVGGTVWCGLVELRGRGLASEGWVGMGIGGTA